MSLSVAIVGLPNVGKSTLFNALLAKQLAYAANFPFATIEPNIGVVPVPDERLEFLAETIATAINSQFPISNQLLNSSNQFKNKDKWPPIVPATVEFVDVAGLIEGAHKGEGLGNKFLSHIRSTDAVMHVVRVFDDTNIIREGSVDPKRDFEIISTELAMADYETLLKQKEPKALATKEDKYRWSAVTKILKLVKDGKPASGAVLTEEEKKESRQLTLLTSKPILVALNVDENSLVRADEIEENLSSMLGVEKNQVVAICAKTEEELSQLSTMDAKDYLLNIGIEKTGLERLIKKAFTTLGLITFLTAGEKEVRAWTIKNGINAKQASGVIHTDFSNKFIKADVVDFDKFVEVGGWKMARERGLVRIEGADYIVGDGDVIEFRVGR